MPHLQRRERYGDPEAGPPVRLMGAGSLNKSNGYFRLMQNGVTKSLHVWIAEKALGKPLPPGAEVHHADGNKADNDPPNLVVCPDALYHDLLHQRLNARAAGAPLHWRKCRFCKRHDDPTNLFIDKTNVHHRECINAYYREKRRAA